ncbi:MAG TPA: phosphoribosylglycinamide formyltransferase, partial [Chitinophagaceae bacterium]|nr:phosphoribosylglycinamide formyltransferase [Chitinophagaceae bacterium]
GSPVAEVGLIVCNKPGAGVLSIASQERIPSVIIEKEKFFRGDAYLGELKQRQIDFLVLAGFLWKIPQALIDAYPKRIVNIHPALLPKYGGKGLYGSYVHEAVLANQEKESGISIHYVDEHYDHGDLIFQARCDVDEQDTPGSLAERVHQLEHKHYSRVIEEILTGDK